MAEVKVVNVGGEEVGTVTLKDEVFAVPANEALVHEVVVGYQANRRQGTASTKTRAETSGGGAKPWRQKGTGRARAGSIRSPIWRGGGAAFGPKPRDYRTSVPKRKRQQALKSVLSASLSAGSLLVVDEIECAEPKTRLVAQMLNDLGVERKALIIITEPNREIYLATRNLASARAVPVSSLNALDVLDAENVVIERQAIEKLERRLS